MTNLFFDVLFAALLLSINAAAMAFDMVVLSHQAALRQFKKMPVWVQKQAVTLVVVPLLLSPLLPQLRFEASLAIAMPLGIILMMTGAVLTAGAFVKIGVVPGIRPKSRLLTTGVYGLVRHPIYSGTLLAFLGLGLALRALISVLYWPIALLLYLVMAGVEERQLIREYGGEYVEYMSQVKARLIPFVV